MAAPITFTDEQAMLLETAGAFCADKSPIAAVRARLGSEHGFDRALWDEMAALGWPGLAVVERHGGAGLSLAAAATIAEPMGRHLLATPFGGVQLVVAALAASGHDAFQAAWLPRIAQGAIAVPALFESEGDWRLDAPAARAERSGATVRLSGGKTLVCDAGAADLFLVSLRCDGAPALAVLDAALLPAGRRRDETVIDATRRSFALDLDGVELPATALIAGPGALAALRALRDAALLLAAAEACGGLAGVLAVTVGYLNLREAFGRKIGSYQALKHSCADSLVALERGRSLLYAAATQMAAGEDAEVLLRMAKSEACDAFAHAADRSVQFHGGFGFTWDCDAQLYLRRALWLQYAHGDGPHHRRRLAELLLD